MTDTWQEHLFATTLPQLGSSYLISCPSESIVRLSFVGVSSTASAHLSHTSLSLFCWLLKLGHLCSCAAQCSGQTLQYRSVSFSHVISCCVLNCKWYFSILHCFRLFCTDILNNVLPSTLTRKLEREAQGEGPLNSGSARRNKWSKCAKVIQ